MASPRQLAFIISKQGRHAVPLGAYRIRYEPDGPESGPAYMLVNGLTLYAERWRGYRDALIAKNFRVLTFDIPEQGESDKPSLSSTSTTRSRRYAPSSTCSASGRFFSPVSASED